MRPNRLLKGVRAAIIPLLLLSLVALCGATRRALLATSPEHFDVVALPGADGSANNVAFVFDRYAAIAPYMPSKEVDENTPLEEYDNHYVYFIDTKKPDAQPKRGNLISGNKDQDACYYPTKVIFDSTGDWLYVRGTKIKELEPKGFETQEVIAKVHVNIDNGKPEFNDSVVLIDIPPPPENDKESEAPQDVPSDFALTRNGDYLVFTNGATIFTYHVVHGYPHAIDIVPPGEYGDDYRINYLGLDAASNTIITCVTKNNPGEGVYRSEIYLHKLLNDGTVDLIKRMLPDDFPKGTRLTPGSNVAIGGDPKTEAAEFALFVASDGTLYQMDLLSPGDRVTIKPLQFYPDLATGEGEDAGPRVISYDRVKRLVGIVKHGYRTQIHRPVNGRPGGGRPGGIHRPVNSHKVLESSAIVLAKLKKGKINSQGVFVSEFEDEGGVTNLALIRDTTWVVSTYSGKLFTLDAPEDLSGASLGLVEKMIPRVDHLAYLPTYESIVAISSRRAGVDEDEQIATGSLILAKMDASTKSLAVKRASTAMPPSGFLAPILTSIRRPCN